MTTITCPKCQNQFALDDLAQQQFAKKEEKIKAEYRQKALEWAQKKAKEQAQKQVERKLKDQEIETKDLKNQLEEQLKKQKDFQEKELKLRKQTRELEQKAKDQELQLQRKIDEEKEKLKEQFKADQEKALSEKLKQSEEEHQRKSKEKDQQMEQLRNTIQDLKRKSEQGSMQIQGDAQEEDLKRLLKETFPLDTIEDVPTGMKGGDLIHTIKNKFGQKLGVILWESKSTKSWSDDWLKKLKEDQGRAKADICILVSQVVPEQVKGFDYIKNVWVTKYEFALPLIHTIRMHLQETYKIKSSVANQDKKMAELFKYLSSNQFKNRIENLVLTTAELKKNLDQEKRAMEKLWKRREKELEGIMVNTGGMYGELQGITGNALPEVPSLELTEG